MRELLIFADESGDKTEKTRYFLLTLVFHDQANSIAERVAICKRSLANADLPKISFRSEPLLNGHGEYESLKFEQRKKLLSGFAALIRYLPIKYAKEAGVDAGTGSGVDSKTYEKRLAERAFASRLL